MSIVILIIDKNNYFRRNFYNRSFLPESLFFIIVQIINPMIVRFPNMSNIVYCLKKI
jgi:hypothetical protein